MSRFGHYSVLVELRNGSAETGGFRAATVVRPVDLPTRSRKTFSFVVFNESPFHPVRVRVFYVNREIQLKKIDMSSHAVHERLVVTLNPEISLDSLSSLDGISEGEPPVSSL